MSANFDLIARLYRPLEYLTLGRSLERCRLHHLPDLHGSARALVLGDGDGRFLSRLLTAYPTLHADAVDSSAAMLALLRSRCRTAASRLRLHHADALAFAAFPHTLPYDLVVTHFFLDCLTQPQLDALVANLAPHLTPGALWLVSDFRIPTGPLQFPARLLVRGLYLVFRILTGLRVQTLSDYATPLARAGLTCIAQRRSLGGILTTELWSLAATTRPAPRS
jgi:ubiquinone/menaquinone biosynthesis C-methylase UbiE